MLLITGIIIGILLIKLYSFIMKQMFHMYVWFVSQNMRIRHYIKTGHSLRKFDLAMKLFHSVNN